MELNVANYTIYSMRILLSIEFSNISWIDELGTHFIFPFSGIVVH
jgi:hypothetical protein